MQPTDSPPTPPRRRRRRRSTVARVVAAAAVAATGLFQLSGTAPTQAAVVAHLTVDTLDYGGDDADPGDGTCATSAGACSLRAAVQEANALDAGPDDTVLIDFDDDLSGFIVGPHAGSAANRMKTGVIVSGWSHDGAYYHLTAPMTIDFGGDVGFTSWGDAWADAFLIDGPNVTIRNFTAQATNPPGTAGNRTVRGLTGPESTFTVTGNGDGFTLENGLLAEINSNWNERGILILDGADDITVRDVEFDAFENFGGAIRVLTNAKLKNLTLDGVTMRNSVGESFYHGVVTENGVEIDGLRVVDSTFSGWKGDRIFYLERATIKDGLFEGNRFEDVVRNAIRHILDFEAGSLTDVDFVDNTFDSVGADRMFDFTYATLNRVEMTGNQFLDLTSGTPNASLLNLVDLRVAKATDLLFAENTIDGLDTVGGWKPFDLTSGGVFTNVRITDNSFRDVNATGSIVDARSSSFTELVIADNTFEQVTTNWRILDLEGATTDRVTFADNVFTETGAGDAAVLVNRPSTNSVVERNTWVNSGTTPTYGRIFNFANGSVAPTTSAGWAVRDNHVQVAPGSATAPIRVDSGLLPVERNTFAPPARGTTLAEDSSAQSETGSTWFVFNDGSNANSKLRTWYPNAAEVDAGTGRARLTVQPPTAGETPHPATPVAIDVYYSPGAGGQRQADRYLGRITGVTAETTFELNCAGCSAGGFLRVQTIAPNGATTQYSRIAQAVAGDIPAVGLGVDLEDGDEVPVGSTITGTGTPGNTIQVVNTETDEVLCTTVVEESGFWSCTVDFDVTQGDGSIVVYEIADGDPVDETDPVDVEIVPAPVVLGLADGDEVAVGSTVSGTGNPGTTVEVVDTDTDEVLCTAVVAADGTWSCALPFDAARGPATLVARELDDQGDPVSTSAPVDVDIVAAPVVLDLGPGDEVAVGSTVSGTGNPGTTVEVVDTDTDEVLCTAVVEADGTWSCEVDPDATQGPATLVARELDDQGDPVASSAPVPVTLVPAPVVPGEAVDDHLSYVPGEPAVVDVLANDVAPTGAAFDPTTLVLLDGSGDPQTTLVVPGEGTYEVDPVTGVVTFTPEPGFSGTTSPITYRVEDEAGNVYTALLTLTEAPVVGVSMVGPGALAALGLAAGALALSRRRTALA